MTFSPIALFTYNRLDHTRRTIEALKKNDLAAESELFIFSDGGKNQTAQNKTTRTSVEEVRKYLRTITGFKKIEIIERSENRGLAKSIMAGVSEMTDRFGRVIVLEDDLVTSPHFLTYMNDALQVYADDERVASIHGYVYPVKKSLPETFFLRGADCWGWATWKRAWDTFEQDGSKLLHQLEERNLVRAFDLDGAYSFSGMLRRQIEGKNSSWAVRWHASNFLANKLTLYPGISLLDNIGHDQSGTHSSSNANANTNENRFSHHSLSAHTIHVTKIPVEENRVARQIIIDFFRSSTQGQQMALFKNLIKKITPSPILDLFREKSNYGFFGNYLDWETARKNSVGYDSSVILEKSRVSALKVQEGKAALERDGVALDTTEQSPPIHSALTLAAQRHPDRLDVIDFGGGLGMSYIQNKAFLDTLTRVRWHIVEQENFVNAGRELFQNGNPTFFTSLEDASKGLEPHLFLASSSLQYLEKPFDLLNNVIKKDYAHIVFDRTPLWNKPDTIVVQKVHPRIYDASYPARIFSLQSFKEFFSKNGYSLIAEVKEGTMSYEGRGEKVDLMHLSFMRTEPR